MANVTVHANGNIQACNRIGNRTSSDRLYAFVTEGTNIRAKKGNQNGEPTSFSTIASLTGITSLEDIGVAVAIGSDNIFHIMYSVLVSMGEAVRYVTFDPSTDTFGTPEDISSLANQTTTTQRLGICVDANNDPHVIWRDSINFMGGDRWQELYANKIGGSWSTKLVIVQQDTSDLITTNYDIMIARPTSAIGEDRPIICGIISVALHAYHGNALNATDFTSTQVVGGSIVDNNVNPITFAIDTAESIFIAIRESVSFDLQTFEHVFSNSWSTWGELDVDTSQNYIGTAITIDGANIYIFVEDEDNSDLNLWKDVGSGFVEETTDTDLPNVGTFSNVKSTWASKNNNSPRELDYFFEDASGNILYNTFQGEAPPASADNEPEYGLVIA